MNSEREILKRLLEFDSPEGTWTQGRGYYYCTDASGKKVSKTREEYRDAAAKYNKPKGLHSDPKKYVARVLNDKASDDIYKLSDEVLDSIPKDQEPVQYIINNQKSVQSKLPNKKFSCNAYASLISNVLDKLNIGHKIHVGFAVPSQSSSTGSNTVDFLKRYKGDSVANHVWVELEDGTILDTFNGAPAESRKSMKVAYDSSN